MHCNSCKTDRLVSDFINNDNICYRCVYWEKLTKNTEKRIDKEVFCRTCKTLIITKKDLKKRQRTVFCSCECAAKGHKQQLDNHWTRKIYPRDSCKK